MKIPRKLSLQSPLHPRDSFAAFFRVSFFFFFFMDVRIKSIEYTVDFVRLMIETRSKRHHNSSRYYFHDTYRRATCNYHIIGSVTRSYCRIKPY